MSKFTEFFKAKATQIAIIAVSASLVVGASAGVAIHNNNKKLEAALYELTSTSTTESVTESSSETTTESTTESTTASATKTTITTTEPAGDRTIQYLAEYEKITREYEKKKAELKKEVVDVIVSTETTPHNASDEEKIAISEANSEILSNAAIQSEKVDKARKEIEKLENQYKKDIENLKREYGIID